MDAGLPHGRLPGLRPIPGWAENESLVVNDSILFTGSATFLPVVQNNVGQRIAFGSGLSG